VLLSDIIIASEDARFGTPYARVWGCYLTGMWLYRLGLTRVKSLALTGDSISGQEAARLGLINAAVPAEQLDQEVRRVAGRLAQIPSSQLAAMKLVINQAYENMGLQTTQWMGWILDGYMRNTPEGLRFVQAAKEGGVAAAVSERDAPFGDYSHAPQPEKPRGVP
jgi:enoyl-CoA hydratase